MIAEDRGHGGDAGHTEKPGQDFSPRALPGDVSRLKLVLLQNTFALKPFPTSSI